MSVNPQYVLSTLTVTPTPLHRGRSLSVLYLGRFATDWCSCHTPSPPSVQTGVKRPNSFRLPKIFHPFSPTPSSKPTFIIQVKTVLLESQRILVSSSPQVTHQSKYSCLEVSLLPDLYYETFNSPVSTTEFILVSNLVGPSLPHRCVQN